MYIQCTCTLYSDDEDDDSDGYIDEDPQLTSQPSQGRCESSLFEKTTATVRRESPTDRSPGDDDDI